MSTKTILECIPKWITLSVRKQFVERTQNIPVMVEELIKSTTKHEQYVELRIDGPYVQFPGTKNEAVATIEVNALLTVAYSERETMRLQKLQGVVIRALQQDFCVYRLGDEPEDTKAFVETLVYNTPDDIQTSNFGQIDTTNKVYQSTIEAHYTMRFRDGTV